MSVIVEKEEARFPERSVLSGETRSLDDGDGSE